MTPMITGGSHSLFDYQNVLIQLFISYVKNIPFLNMAFIQILWKPFKWNRNMPQYFSTKLKVKNASCFFIFLHNIVYFEVKKFSSTFFFFFLYWCVSILVMLVQHAQHLLYLYDSEILNQTFMKILWHHFKQKQISVRIALFTRLLWIPSSKFWDSQLVTRANSDLSPHQENN